MVHRVGFRVAGRTVTRVELGLLMATWSEGQKRLRDSECSRSMGIELRKRKERVGSA